MARKMDLIQAAGAAAFDEDAAFLRGFESELHHVTVCHDMSHDIAAITHGTIYYAENEPERTT